MTPPSGGTSPGVPEGYARHESGKEKCDFSELPKGPAPQLPAGYKKSKRKYDEKNPRPPRHMGPKHVCVCCYRGSPTYLDRICPRCMKDRHELAKVEQEIVAEIPSTASMSSAEIMRRLWKQNGRLLTRVEKLKAVLEYRTLDASDKLGKVGHR